jgi:hypothetical protein
MNQQSKIMTNSTRLDDAILFGIILAAGGAGMFSPFGDWGFYIGMIVGAITGIAHIRKEYAEIQKEKATLEKERSTVK